MNAGIDQYYDDDGEDDEIEGMSCDLPPPGLNRELQKYSSAQLSSDYVEDYSILHNQKNDKKRRYYYGYEEEGHYIHKITVVEPNFEVKVDAWPYEDENYQDDAIYGPDDIKYYEFLIIKNELSIRGKIAITDPVQAEEIFNEFENIARNNSKEQLPKTLCEKFKTKQGKNGGPILSFKAYDLLNKSYFI